MLNKENQYLLALKAINGVGNISAFKLIDHFGSAEAVFNASANELKALKLKPTIIEQITAFDWQLLAPCLDWLKQENSHLITYSSAFYPPLLKQIHNPPLLLFGLGDPELLNSTQIAVVGSRSPTPQGINSTHALCEALVEQGVTITSGLASGIDGEAHKACLRANGSTIAVTGTGLKRVYPAIHRELAHQIADKGLLVSEHFPEESAQAGRFPARNRIIAGLSLGTLVIEAAAKSGTLITANHAVEEGREVFAVPGSIHSPMSKGCHKLIKQGAKLVETIDDIVDDLPCLAKGLLSQVEKSTSLPAEPEIADLLQLIDYEITPLDTIVARSQLTVDAVTNKLLLLELQGWVINSTGGYIRQQ